MYIFRKLAVISVALISITSINAAAIDVDAPVVKVRHVNNGGCLEGGVELNNCFTAMADLNAWIQGTRRPDATRPLAVDIGPGKFGGGINLNCDSVFTGFTTFTGAGRLNTTIGTSSTEAYGVNILNCTSMTFRDMKIGPGNSAFGGINWNGTGKSVWQNIDLFTTGTYGWQDVTSSCPASGARGAHYWFNSRLVSTGRNSAHRIYKAQCSEDWFFGSEVSINAGSSFRTDAYVLNARGARTEIHVYGGVLRAITGTGISAPPFQTNGTLGTHGMAIAVATEGAQIHIHGTGIDMLSTESNPLTVLAALNGGSIHAAASAYNLNTGPSGSVTRINTNAGTGHIHAPYLWEHIPNTDGNGATVDTNYISTNGADQTTVTTGTSDGHPHPAIYSSTCPFNARWYDTVDKVCRSQ